MTTLRTILKLIEKANIDNNVKLIMIDQVKTLTELYVNGEIPPSVYASMMMDVLRRLSIELTDGGGSRRLEVINDEVINDTEELVKVKDKVVKDERMNPINDEYDGYSKLKRINKLMGWG